MEPAKSLTDHFATILSSGDHAGPLAEIVALLAAGETDSREYARVGRDYGVAHEDWFRKDLAKLLIGVLEAMLQIGRITAADQRELDRLKERLGLRPGDLVRYHAGAAANLLEGQLEMLLADGEIDASEDLYQVELQRAFDLGYDEYLELAWPAMERVMAQLSSALARREGTGEPEEQHLRNKVAMLAPHYRLAAANHGRRA